MSKVRIVSTGPVMPPTEEILEKYGDIEIVDVAAGGSLEPIIHDVEVLIVRGEGRISAELIDAAPRLKVIARSGVGYDNVDVRAATRRGIPVVFTPGAGARAVAEGTMALLLCAVKRLIDLDRETKAGRWSVRNEMAIGDLYEQVIGIVGIGRIGQHVAAMAKAFGMEALAYDPAIPDEAIRGFGAEPVSFEALIRRSDVISLHLPLTPETRHMIDKDVIGKMKRGAILLNLARGGLIESLDVIYDALESGALSAVGFDVFPDEPPDVSHPLFRHPRAVCSPHAMALTGKASYAMFKMMSEGIALVLEGRRPGNVVNPEVFDR